MLILTRKAEQAIVIKAPGGDIIVRVLNVDGERIKVGVDAPKGVAIFREELLQDDPEPRNRPKPEGRRNPRERL